MNRVFFDWELLAKAKYLQKTSADKICASFSQMVKENDPCKFIGKSSYGWFLFRGDYYRAKAAGAER